MNLVSRKMVIKELKDRFLVRRKYGSGQFGEAVFAVESGLCGGIMRIFTLAATLRRSGKTPGLQACQTQRRQALLFHPFRDFYAATGLCRDASNGTPDFSTPYATCASLRIIEPRITFPFLPLAANARPHSVLLVATIAGIYNGLRSDTCPALLNRLAPLTLLPDS